MNVLAGRQVRALKRELEMADWSWGWCQDCLIVSAVNLIQLSSEAQVVHRAGDDRLVVGDFPES